MARLRHARLVRDGKIWENYRLCYQDGRITGIEPDNAAALLPDDTDLQNRYLLPGFVDIHTHGAGGADFMDGTAEAFETALAMHLSHGTTSICPTTTTGAPAEMLAVFDAYREVKAKGGVRPTLLGVHLEGPYLSPAQKGAQDPRYLRDPDPAEVETILRAAQDDLLIWTVAPELPGADQLARDLRPRGIYFSMGHSDAQYKHALAAAEAGYTMVTHLFSGMSTITREDGFRRLGLIESGLLMDELYTEIICDGCHLPPELLRLILKCKPHDKIILITDSMRAAGMPEGEYRLGSATDGLWTIVEDGVAKLPDHLSFAGSVATTDRLLRTMVQMAGLPLEEAVPMLTLNPATAINRQDEIGSLDVGKQADFVVMDESLQVKNVFVKGIKAK